MEPFSTNKKTRRFRLGDAEFGVGCEVMSNREFRRERLSPEIHSSKR